MDTMGEGEGGTNRESSVETYTLPFVKYKGGGNLLYDVGNSDPLLCDNLEGWDGLGGGAEVQREGTYVYLWQIHVGVWQKPILWSSYLSVKE